MSQQLTLHLSLIKGVGPATLQKLQKHPAFHELYACKVDQLIRVYQVSEKVAQCIVTGLQDRELLEKELKLIKDNDISWVTLADEGYPPSLKEIEYPPLVLYYRGADLRTFEKNIAIIGSRKAGPYAEQVIAACVPHLLDAGWHVVSGGAIGADTMAHMHTVAHEGRTVAILGSGLLCPYPSSNKKLFDLIVQNGGAVVSSFPLLTTAYPSNFPARNRIIAGMSQACLVVQAAERSGASITAHFALHQGKQVLAVPGSIFDPLSAGCHALIKEGATPILSPQDLLKELGETSLIQTTITQALSTDRKHDVPIEKRKTAVHSDAMPNLPDNPTATDLIQFHCRNPLSAEDLLQYVPLEFDELQNYLFDLQLEGRIEQNAVGLWQVSE